MSSVGAQKDAQRGDPVTARQDETAIPEVTMTPTQPHPLQPGDRVCFTGKGWQNRELMIRWATEAGCNVIEDVRAASVLVIGGLTRDRVSRKERVAGQAGVPIMEDAAFRMQAEALAARRRRSQVDAPRSTASVLDAWDPPAMAFACAI